MSSGNGTAPPRVSLLALNRKIVGEVEIEGDDGNGRWVGVRQFTGETYHAHQQAAAEGGAGALAAMYEIAGKLLIGATPSEVQRLTVESVNHVLSIAGGLIADVQKVAEAQAEGNASGSASPPSNRSRKGSRATSSPLTK